MPLSTEQAALEAAQRAAAHMAVAARHLRALGNDRAANEATQDRLRFLQTIQAWREGR